MVEKNRTVKLPSCLYRETRNRCNLRCRSCIVYRSGREPERDISLEELPMISELLARGGMRIGEVLKLTPADIDGIKIILLQPKSGWDKEVVFIPKRVSERLRNYVKDE